MFAVDGVWSAWSPWGDCSVSCGDNATQHRSRVCDSPKPASGGQECPGADNDSQNCDDLKPCPGVCVGVHTCIHTVCNDHLSLTNTCQTDRHFTLYIRLHGYVIATDTEVYGDIHCPAWCDVHCNQNRYRTITHNS